MKKYRATHLLLPSFVATTAMTLFSFLLSKCMKQNFKEPELLEVFINERMGGGSLVSGRMMAWLVHYNVGFLWALLYKVLFGNSKMKANGKSGVVFGIICGTGSVLGWKNLFRIQKQKPVVDLSLYYRQLFVAHIIFSLVLTKRLTHRGELSPGPVGSGKL